MTSQLVQEQVWGFVLELIRHQPSDFMQGMCPPECDSVVCRETWASSQLSAVGAGNQLEQSAFRQGCALLSLKWLWNRRHATTSAYQCWLRLFQSSLCYLAWLWSALQILHISFGSIDCDQPVVPFDASHCLKKKKKKAKDQLITVLLFFERAIPAVS